MITYYSFLEKKLDNFVHIHFKKKKELGIFMRELDLYFSKELTEGFSR